MMKEPRSLPNLTETLEAWCRLVEHAPVAMALTLDASHTLRCVSPALALMFDAAPSELLDRPLAEAVSLINSAALVTLLDRVFATGMPEVSAMLEHVHPQRGLVSYTCAVWRIGLDDGGPTGLAIQLQDVTSHVQTHHTDTTLAVHLREVNEHLVLAGLREHAARAEAEAALAVRDQFLSIAAHELKGPLTALNGYTYMLEQTLARTESNALTQRAVSMIERQAKRVDALIDQLLDVSRIERGQFSIDQQWLDLRVLAARVVENVRLTLTQHTLTLTVPDQPLLVLGDDVRLEQVMQNLLNNAVKYSPRGGPVTVALARAGADALLEVTDQGIGIPVDAQGHLFDSFFRATNAGQHSSGFGIGLYVVKEIVTQHGGRVEVESREAEGSTFRVVLPLQVERAA